MVAEQGVEDGPQLAGDGGLSIAVVGAAVCSVAFGRL
jgi:hypothetical protein